MDLLQIGQMALRSWQRISAVSCQLATAQVRSQCYPLFVSETNLYRSDFPKVPDTNTFINLGLNNGPVFFGCDASDLSGSPPIIVYLPNAPYVYNSNVSTFDLEYNDTERNAIVSNGYNLATQGNSTLDEQWPTCVGCAILSRSLDRTGTKVPDVCRKCFDRYCWSGKTDSSKPKSYVPKMKLDQLSLKSAAGKFAASATLALSMAMIASLLLV